MTTLKELHESLDSVMRVPAGIFRTRRGPEGRLELRLDSATPEGVNRVYHHGFRFSEADEATVLWYVQNIVDQFTLVNGSPDFPPTLYFHKGADTLLAYWVRDRGCWYGELYPSLPRPSYHQNKELRELLKHFKF